MRTLTENYRDKKKKEMSGKVEKSSWDKEEYFDDSKNWRIFDCEMKNNSIMSQLVAKNELDQNIF